MGRSRLRIPALDNLEESRRHYWETKVRRATLSRYRLQAVALALSVIMLTGLIALCVWRFAFSGPHETVERQQAIFIRMTHAMRHREHKAITLDAFASLCSEVGKSVGHTIRVQETESAQGQVIAECLWDPLAGELVLVLRNGAAAEKYTAAESQELNDAGIASVRADRRYAHLWVTITK